MQQYRNNWQQLQQSAAILQAAHDNKIAITGTGHTIWD